MGRKKKEGSSKHPVTVYLDTKNPVEGEIIRLLNGQSRIQDTLLTCLAVGYLVMRDGQGYLAPARDRVILATGATSPAHTPPPAPVAPPSSAARAATQAENRLSDGELQAMGDLLA